MRNFLTEKLLASQEEFSPIEFVCLFVQTRKTTSNEKKTHELYTEYCVCAEGFVGYLKLLLFVFLALQPIVVVFSQLGSGL